MMKMPRYQEDCMTLKKLLFRNKSQHRNTEVYNYLHSFSKKLRELSYETILSVDSKAARVSFRLNKETSRNVSDAMETAGELKTILITCGAAFEWGYRAGKALLSQIANQQFLALYMTLYALCASLFQELLDASFRLRNHHQHIITSLERIALLNEKLSDCISSGVTQHRLPAETLDALLTLKQLSSTSKAEQVVASTLVASASAGTVSEEEDMGELLIIQDSKRCRTK